MLHLTVGRNGEDYYTIQEALDAVRKAIELSPTEERLRVNEKFMLDAI